MSMQVDAISDTLQQRCGTFCSADDVLLYKVGPVAFFLLKLADRPAMRRESRRSEEQRSRPTTLSVLTAFASPCGSSCYPTRSASLAELVRRLFLKGTKHLSLDRKSVV